MLQEMRAAHSQVGWIPSIPKRPALPLKLLQLSIKPTMFLEQNSESFFFVCLVFCFFVFFLQYDSFLVENIVLKSSGDAQHGRFYTFYTVFQFDQYPN